MVSVTCFFEDKLINNTKAHILAAANYCINELEIDKIEEIQNNIVIVFQERQHFIPEHIMGSAHLYVKDGRRIVIARIYTRKEKKLRHSQELIRTLFHEMVHVKQFATNILRVERNENYDNLFWNNEHYQSYINNEKDMIFLKNGKNIHYKELPWEIEAFGKDHALMKEYYSTFDIMTSFRILGYRLLLLYAKSCVAL